MDSRNERVHKYGFDGLTVSFVFILGGSDDNCGVCARAEATPVRSNRDLAHMVLRGEGFVGLRLQKGLHWAQNPNRR